MAKAQLATLQAENARLKKAIEKAEKDIRETYMPACDPHDASADDPEYLKIADKLRAALDGPKDERQGE